MCITGTRKSGDIHPGVANKIVSSEELLINQSTTHGGSLMTSGNQNICFTSALIDRTAVK